MIMIIRRNIRVGLVTLYFVKIVGGFFSHVLVPYDLNLITIRCSLNLNKNSLVIH
jgi:hypothetical protein